MVHHFGCGLLLHQLALTINVAQLPPVAMAPGVCPPVSCGHRCVTQAGRHTHHVGQVQADWKACERHLRVVEEMILSIFIINIAFKVTSQGLLEYFSFFF